MPTKGQIVTNPISGDSYEFLQTARDTQGQFVSMKATIHRQGKSVPDHFHTQQDETFEVIAGQLTIIVDGKTSVLSAGEQITLVRNRPHNHYNASGETVIYKHTVQPALDFEYLIENLFGLLSDSRRRDGKLSMVQQLVTLKYLDSKSFLADISPRVQILLMNTIAPVARLFGYRAIYKKYSGIEK